MRKGSKNGCKSAAHQHFKDKAKNRVDDLQGIFMDLQYARKESRATDVAILEEQVHQMLREWKAELNEPSPASSLLGGSLESFSADICQLLQRFDEEDDATSALSEAPVSKTQPEVPNVQLGEITVFQEDLFMNGIQEKNGFEGIDDYKASVPETLDMLANNSKVTTDLDYHQFDICPDLYHDIFIGFGGTGQCNKDAMFHIPGLLSNNCPPPSAFLGPKCALWDCPRPAQGSESCQDYCNVYHAALALNEGPPGVNPIIRPSGIGLKDGPLFAALSAKAQGKNVGIPECGGAATTKSPWNAPELFDISFFEGETIREWLFFDKPRRAFESGNRKQRSLPDYTGRGWHESRKQEMKEFGGLKRSYYMDPQPLSGFDWHLYEYEISNCDACALYRLEFKLIDGKKSPKGKVIHDSLADLQKQMGRLNSEIPADNKRSVRSRTKVNPKDNAGNVYPVPSHAGSTNEAFTYGTNNPYSYLVDNANDYHGT